MNNLKWYIAIAFAIGITVFIMRISSKIKLFLENYEILIMDKEEHPEIQQGPTPVLALKPANYDHSIDLRGVPTHVCPCGSDVWNLKVIFDDFEIATYFLDMECVSCGSVATAPTPIDKREME